MKKVQQGFTLIELMIVVAIIGILAAIAIPAYQDYTIRSQVSEALSLASGSKVAVAEFFQNNGELPDTNLEAGVPAAATITGNYVSQVAVTAGGVIQATFSSTAPQDAHNNIDTATLTLSPVTATAGSMSWDCTGTGALAPATNPQWLPSSCR